MRILSEIFEADKVLASAPAWNDVAVGHPRDATWLDRLYLTAPVEIDSEIIEGLFFRMSAKMSIPDEAVVAQLEYHPIGEKCGPLCRVEWRPLKAHNNKARGPAELRHKWQRGSHIHPFDLNYRDVENKMRSSNLPVAVPIDPDPNTYTDLLVYIEQAFRIRGITSIGTPSWERELI